MILKFQPPAHVGRCCMGRFAVSAIRTQLGTQLPHLGLNHTVDV